MFTGILHTHILSVILFLLLYLVKTGLLITGKDVALEKVSKATKHPERLISVLFLGTGIYLLFGPSIIDFNDPPKVMWMFYLKITMVFASIPLAIIGFKKKNKILAVLSVFLLILSYGMAEMFVKRASEEGEGNPINREASPAQIGRDLYLEYCKKCHGPGGDAEIAGAKNLKVTTLSADEQASIIRNGKGAMPAFEKLSSSDVQAIVKHVQNLKK